MNDNTIPTYTINQEVYISNFDDFTISKSFIHKRVWDTDAEEFFYIFKSIEGEEREFDEEDIHLTFKEAKAHMEAIVTETLTDVRTISKSDVQCI